MLQASSTRETRESAREVKFLLTPAIAEKVREWASARLGPDPYGSGSLGDEYKTTSLYFDTPQFAVYHRQGSYRRTKYRIRRYGAADVVFLERKLRTSEMLVKRRTTIPMADLPLVAAETMDPTWAGRWFRQRVEARQLAPVCQVSYHRHARVGHAQFGPLRLTFDDQIHVQSSGGLSFEPDAGVPVLQTHTVMEMKYRAVMPAILRHLVEEFSLAASAVSKYRLSMEAMKAAGLRAGASEVDLTQALQPHVIASEETRRA
ncbi:MAG: polyphosphate polymerase domain-containing protein [Vicinamibacterales bacterium]